MSPIRCDSVCHVIWTGHSSGVRWRPEETRPAEHEKTPPTRLKGQYICIGHARRVGTDRRLNKYKS